MNRYTEFYKSALLAVAAIALTGTLALADDLSVSGISPADTNIVVAKARLPAKTPSETASLQDDQDEAVAETIENLMDDNKLQLDLRLSGHKSVILAAD
jgi:hypothetical protein